MRRLVWSPDAVWLVVASPSPDGGHEIGLERVAGRSGTEPRVDVVDPAVLTGTGSRLGEVLLAAGPVVRVRTGDLWDALVGAVFRDAMPCYRARAVYRATAVNFGTGHDTSLGREWVFPGPALVLELPPEVFDVDGLRQVRDRLRTVAWVARELESRWRAVPWDGLATLLAHVPRIRSLIGGAAIADLSGDFRALATSDFLVKQHVHALDPTTPWPRSAEHFGARWQAMTGIERSAWTTLVLAAGAWHTRRVP
ncbi:hypothetical protein [Amycolatopsis thailandensis]|uniref:hypothetical protein n=1 Tax=Amycolatopsis thailandensis TaxID=589330 RepID=UPI0011779B96|nr:hypothetical protein [Amycolatopsis thailandensis]